MDSAASGQEAEEATIRTWVVHGGGDGEPARERPADGPRVEVAAGAPAIN